ncbi:7872_t:CDS:1, partial [Ambispora leptoticha]
IVAFAWGPRCFNILFDIFEGPIAFVLGASLIIVSSSEGIIFVMIVLYHIGSIVRI